MPEYLIPPDLCLVVRAFSRTDSLRKAAQLHGCDPGSLVRKAKLIAAKHGLMRKTRGRWELTDSGRRMVQWLDQSIGEQRAALEAKPALRVATTMWLAEQVLLPGLQKLDVVTKKKFAWEFLSASTAFEADLLDGGSDYVIACYPPEDPAIAYRRVAQERWIAVAPANWTRALSGLSGSTMESFLSKRPFIRHSSMNPADALGEWADELEPSLIVDNLIAVRSAVTSGEGWSCMPEIAARSHLEAGRIVRLDLPVGLSGYLCLWWLRARKDAEKNVAPLIKWLHSAVR